MNRLAEEIGPLGFSIPFRRPCWPTRRSPCGVKATTEGVVRDPSAFGITVGWPATVAEITELVVPRSMPTATAITASYKVCAPRCPGHRGLAERVEPACSRHRALVREHAEAGQSAGDLDLAWLGGL